MQTILCGPLTFKGSHSSLFGSLAFEEVKHTQIKGRKLSTAPSNPAAPTTSIYNPGISIMISWGAPADGGSAITGYNVLICQSDASTFTIYSSCPNALSLVCIVPFSTLKAAPYNLANGASIYAKVVATNAYGSSAASS